MNIKHFIKQNIELKIVSFSTDQTLGIISLGIMEIDFWSFFRAIGTFFVASVDLEMAFEVKPKANVD